MLQERSTNTILFNVPTDGGGLSTLLAKESTSPAAIRDKLVALMETHIAPGQDLRLSTHSLGPDEVKEAISRLKNYPQRHLPRRLEKIRTRRPRPELDLPDQIEILMAGVVHDATKGRIDGPQARDAAKQLITWLSNRPNEEKEISEIEQKENNILTDEDLARAFFEAERSLVYQVPENVISQLDEGIFELPSKGVIVTPVRLEFDPKERGFGPLERYLEIVKKLENPKSALVLEQFIYDNIVAHPDKTIYFLRSLVLFTAFLDPDTFPIIYKTKSKQIPIQPFHSLSRSIHAARKTLSEINQPEFRDLLTDLADLRDIIFLKYHQAIKGIEEGVETMSTDTAFQLSIPNLTKRFLEEFDDLYTSGVITAAEAAHHSVNFLEEAHASTKNMLEFINELSRHSPSLAQEVLVQLVQTGLINIKNSNPKTLDRKLLRNIENQIMLKTYGTLRTHSWRDARNIDFAQIIPPDCDRVNVCVITLTDDPGHRGHKKLIEATLRYIEQQEFLELNEGRSTKYIVLIAPITSVNGVKGYKKENVAPVGDRLGSLLLELAELESIYPDLRERVFLTLQMQPAPSETPHITARINTTVNNLGDKMNHDLQSAQRHFMQQLQATLVVGSDELDDLQSSSASEVSNNEDAHTGGLHKLQSFDVLIVTRGGQGDKVKIITHHRDILPIARHQVRVMLLNTPEISSTEIKTLVRNKRLNLLPPASRAYYAKHWGQNAKSLECEEDTVESIQKALIEEYQNYIQDVK